MNVNNTQSFASPAAPVPLVSIGLPVFNGERYLRKAIDSVLNQGFADLELIICDNASSDATQQICEDYARADARVRYHRNPRNLGAGPNYDLCFALARGTYFKWAAHDDMLAPDYLALAVAALEPRPDAVLCTVGIREIGPEEQTLRVYQNHFPAAASPDAATRFGCLIHTRHQCEDFFSLYRRAALVGSGLHDTYSGSDRVLLAEMALRGPWVSVAAPLFLHREHTQRYTRAVLLGNRAEAVAWQDTSKPVTKNTMFHWNIYRRYWRLVRRNIAAPLDRLACYWQLLLWWGTDGHLADVLRDVLRNNPELFDRLRAIKHALRGDDHARRSPPPGSLPSLD